MLTCGHGPEKRHVPVRQVSPGRRIPPRRRRRAVRPGSVRRRGSPLPPSASGATGGRSAPFPGSPRGYWRTRPLRAAGGPPDRAPPSVVALVGVDGYQDVFRTCLLLRWDGFEKGEEGNATTAGQTSLEPLHTGKSAEGRTPFMNQDHRSGRQPIHERSLGGRDQNISDPQAPIVELNKFPIRGVAPGPQLVCHPIPLAFGISVRDWSTEVRRRARRHFR